MIDTSLFPYPSFPYRLEFGEKKNPTICYFSCAEHLEKYLTRYKLDQKKLKIQCKDGKSFKISKRRK